MLTSPASCPVINAAYLPENPLYGGEAEGAAGVGWELSPAPFRLNERQHQALLRLGDILLKFMQAVDLLHKQSTKGQMPGWIADLLNQGKPEALLQFAGMKRFKSNLPIVLRPDLLLAEDGWTLCEIDAVPGGMGFTSALNDAYRKSGFSVLEAPETMPSAWLEMLKACVPEKENPVIAVVLSDEASDYRAEMTWLVNKIRETYPDIALIHPKDVDLVRDQLVFQDQDGAYKSIDLVYRFFELFDLPNIPKIELIQYAVKKRDCRLHPALQTSRGREAHACLAASSGAGFLLENATRRCRF